jgi:hypothetical protein
VGTLAPMAGVVESSNSTSAAESTYLESNRVNTTRPESVSLRPPCLWTIPPLMSQPMFLGWYRVSSSNNYPAWAGMLPLLAPCLLVTLKLGQVAHPHQHEDHHVPSVEVRLPHHHHHPQTLQELGDRFSVEIHPLINPTTHPGLELEHNQS